MCLGWRRCIKRGWATHGLHPPLAKNITASPIHSILTSHAGSAPVEASSRVTCWATTLGQNLRSSSVTCVWGCGDAPATHTQREETKTKSTGIHDHNNTRSTYAANSYGDISELCTRMRMHIVHAYILSIAC
jgi:hypothetical protein